MCFFPSPESLGLTKSQVLKSAETAFAKRMFAFQSDDWEDTEEFKTCLEECASGETSKSYRTMLAVVSGLGNGKSRFLHELVGLAKETVDLSRFNTVELRVSFEEESGTGLRDDELLGKNYLVADKILLDRLLFRMLASDGDSFDTFRRENQWGFTWLCLRSHIKTMFKEEKKDAMVFLLIDGIDNLDRYSTVCEYGTTALSSLLYDVTRSITSTPYMFVAYTCTEFTPVLKAIRWSSCSVMAQVVGPPVLTRLPDEVTNEVVVESLPPPPGTDSSPPTKSVLRSWAPGRWNPVRAPAVQQAWVPRQVPTAVTPRSTVNALLLRRARCAAKLFA